MALQLILGRSGAGKSYHLYQKLIAQSMAHPEKKYFVVVPEQFTMQTQKDLVQMHPRHGISNIDVLSFMRLAYRIFEEQGGMKRTVLEDTGKSMFVRRVLGEKREELKTFGRFAKKPGYVSEIKSLLSEFYQYDIKIENLDQMISLAEEDLMLKRKLEDMQIVYKGFEELLAEKYITTEEVLDALIEQLEHTELLQDTVLALDGFTGFTPVQYKLLRRLMKMCPEMLVTVTIDPNEPEALQREEVSLFCLSRETVDKLKKIAEEEQVPMAADYAITGTIPKRFEKNSQLACLEHNLFQVPVQPYQYYCKSNGFSQQEGSVHFFAARDMQGEVEFAMKEIFWLVREEGYRYRDIAIVTGDMEGYSRLVEKACKKADFPCFVDYKEGIGTNPMVELIRSLLQIFTKNFTFEGVFRFLRCGLVDLDVELVDKLENYVLAMGIKGKKRWETQWTRMRKKPGMKPEEKEEALYLLNEVRMQVMEMLKPLLPEFGKKKNQVETYTRALHTFLTEQSVYEKLRKYQNTFEEKKELLLAKEYAQVYTRILEIFDKLVQLLGTEEVTLQEYGDLLETGFEEVKVGLIPPGMEQILLGDMERTRLKDIRALFFLGVNEGIVPGMGEKGGILTDMDRELFAKSQIVLAPTARQTVFTQQFYLYLNMTKPTDKLYLTYHKTNGEGKPALPSSLLRTVKKIFPEIVQEEEVRIRTDQKLNETNMQSMLGVDFGKRYLLDGMRGIGTETLETWWQELYRFYASKQEMEGDLQNWIAGVGFVNQENAMSAQVAQALYGKKLTNSVTRIEQYAACAFAHFLQYGLGLRERYEAHFDGVDFGNVFHRVLRLFPQKLEERGMSWRTAERRELEEMVDHCMREVLEEYDNGALGQDARSAYLVERMERIMKRTVWALAEQLKSSDFEPVGYEIYFESADSLDTARMDLGEERELRLQGQIDRLDIKEEEKAVYVKVIDYKSGKMKFDICNLYYGLQMQLVVYLNAALEMEQDKQKGKAIHPAGIFYYNIDDPLIERVSEEQMDAALLKELRMNGLVNQDHHVLALLDRAFASPDGIASGIRSKVIPVETLKSGEVSKRSSVVSQQQFAVMGKYVNHKIAEDAGKILDGDIAISPYRMEKRTACAYCSYRAVCNFDTKLPGNVYRNFRGMGAQEVFTQMEQEIDQNRKEEKNDHEQ